GVAYCITVALIIAPYLLLGNDWYALALGIMLLTVVLEIAFTVVMRLFILPPIKKEMERL
ncbi:MAG: hypothetical protein UIG59_01090, partial [Acutalibacteraceae bacterium]|nr:hypothetical protein [Acutalibacteraceae bacterium]